jgi:hypothetical protein
VIDADSYPLLAEHARGDSYRTIGRRHGLSHEGARKAVMRQGSAFVNRVEMDLMVAAKYERMGLTSKAVWPGLAIPHGPGWQLGLSLLQWLVDELRDRKLAVRVLTRSVPNGIVFLLTLEELPS